MKDLFSEHSALYRQARPGYSAAIIEEILKHAPEGHILELGAGPGYLAEHLIRHCPDIQYTAFDFSDAMHALAKRKLMPSELERCRFITGDFK
mgnify:CR=1 FL=1